MSEAPTTPLEDAVALHRAGRREDAERLYRVVLAAQPGQGTAHHNLAILLAERGETANALPHFQAAVQAEPSQGQYWISYVKALILAGRRQDAAAVLEQGRGLGLQGPVVDALLAETRKAVPGDDWGLAQGLAKEGHFADAIAALRRLIAAEPRKADAHLMLGDLLAETGEVEPAIAAYRQAVTLEPRLADAWYHLGTVLSENGRIAEGFAAYMRRAGLVYAQGTAPPDKPHPLHRIRMDKAQRDYLVEKGLAPANAVAGQVFHIAPAARLAGPAVRPDLATPQLLERWKTSWPQLIVIDSFLVPEALETLRRYCAESTVWKRDYRAGYTGATPQDGFACPLLAQIAEELIAAFPTILGPHQFHYLGAFKYDSELSTGTNVHADFSAVNVNFYIAPDTANLDPDSGGMRIWDVAARDEAELRHYNGDEAAAEAHVKNATPTVVPHKANRVVIFKSDLFHKTDDCHFALGYLDMRINISLLFGRHGDPA